ncbi:MAG: RpiB/LacA/LacB family sugar-phosphate isomerase [Bacilli bacterium]|nr:RpiB/LacA/LacB family sugar-phosphate isomerase [Bacilli bacterium]
MKIGFASDHRGFQLKNELIKNLKDQYEVEDYGTHTEESTDYPYYAFKLGEHVQKQDVDFGVAICGTGIGISIACNKMKGIRCAKVDTIEEVIATRKDNDSNIIAFGEKMPVEKALEMVKTFVETPTSEEEKHIRRRNMIHIYEEKK